MREVLIVFQKNLELGKVKTRLAKDVGAPKALSIYKSLINFTKQVIDPIHVEKQIWYSSQIEEKDVWSKGEYQKFKQVGDGLGERMSNAFEQAFINAKANKVVIIGTDCGEINTSIIQRAFDQLDQFEFVIGPAFDGGYYLLGMQSKTAEIFENIEWSSLEVLSTTIKRINRLKKTHTLLPKLNDVDTVEDWLKIEHRLK